MEQPANNISAAATASSHQNDFYDGHHVEAAGKYSFAERVQYFLQGNLISSVNRNAVELCVIAEVGRIVNEAGSFNIGVQKEMFINQYAIEIQSLDPSLFISQDLRQKMCTRLENGRKDEFGAKDMYKKWKKMCTELRKVYAKGLPENYHVMGTGTQLTTVHDDLIRNQFKSDYVSNVVSHIVVSSISQLPFDFNSLLNVLIAMTMRSTRR